jgi:hypothetical protein
MAQLRRIPTSIIVTIILWALCTVAIFVLSQGTLPFQLKLFDDKGTPFLGRVIAIEVGLVFPLFLIALIYMITRRRVVPDLRTRAPEISIARAETLGMVGYAVVAQIVGALLGKAMGQYAISLHMPGTLYGLSGSYSPTEAIVWAIYNFIVYAVIPYLYFRRRGYSNEQLSLRSNNWRADLVLIVIVLVLESTAELYSLSTAIFSLHGTQLVLGATLTFVLDFFGTVLPIMIFIYSILLPRYLKLTNSVALTIILGGLTYAALHVGDSWTDYSTISNGLLSIIFVAFQYFGPGMVKSVLTLRTGNAWVHVWSYHAFDPHVLIDTPTIVSVFQIH